ncbi:phage integrase [Collimonas silvisoli]
MGKTCDDAFRRYEKEVSPTKRGKAWEAQRLSTIADMVVEGTRVGDIKLSELTSDFLGQWRDMRLQTVAGSTINRDLNLLSHVFSTATREWKWMAASPTTNVRRPANPSARDRLISPDEIDRITFALGFDGARVFITVQYCGVNLATQARCQIHAIKFEFSDGNSTLEMAFTSSNTTRLCVF